MYQNKHTVRAHWRTQSDSETYCVNQGPNSHQQTAKWHQLIIMKIINIQSEFGRNGALKSEYPSVCEIKTNNRE